MLIYRHSAFPGKDIILPFTVYRAGVKNDEKKGGGIIG
jgi:hypothetical protein